MVCLLLIDDKLVPYDRILYLSEWKYSPQLRNFYTENVILCINFLQLLQANMKLNTYLKTCYSLHILSQFPSL
jgi:aromatic ring hydroxylase